jgi:outer membrane lipoprotein-sorting protein
MERLRNRCSALLIAAALASGSIPGVAQAPQTGAQVFARMHDAYAGKWYSTLRFVQKTTQWKADGTMSIATWYESLRHTDATGTQLRIDLGDPSIGNGTLYSADSTWVVRDGKLTAARAGGNEFLPLIEGVYMQSVERTVAELATTGVDMQRVSASTLDGRPAWVVGARSAADSTSPQLWIDSERLVLLRMILSPAPGAPVMDIQMRDYVALGGGWLATKVVMTVGGKPRQVEDYADWKANVDLSPDLFSPSSWKTAAHWARR